MDLSVVVVNYNSARWLAGLLESIFADTFEVDGRPGRLEVIIVDNASRSEDHARLESFRSERVRLLRNTSNAGYALANNQGLHLARGRWHLVSNPDVLVRRGCIAALLDALEKLPGAAIVGPLATIDLAGDILLPPNELPDNHLEALTSLSRRYPAIARYAARRRARFAWRYWTAREPFPMRMLSGGFFLGRRATFLEHGLFDAGFPLYYEDTDLFRRYGDRGLGMWHVPAARIVHHFSRSALPRMKASMYRNHLGARRYFAKHHGETGLRTWTAFAGRGAGNGGGPECPFPLEQRAPSPEPPVVELPEVDGAYLEIAGNPQFSLTAAVFPAEPGPYAWPKPFWDELAMTHYWCRAVDPRTGGTLKAWRVTKCPAT